MLGLKYFSPENPGVRMEILKFQIFCPHLTAYAERILALNEKPTLQNTKTERDVREMVVHISSL